MSAYTRTNLPTRIMPFDPSRLPQVQGLINAHLTLLVPGWALSQECIADHLESNPGQAITDPWVAERTTLCALEGQRLVAAAHLLRYGSGPHVGPALADTGEIAWFLAWADKADAAATLLAAARARMHAWNVTMAGVWNTGLPVGPFVGVPDVWPHIAAALGAAGFRPSVGDEEEVYGGPLDAVPPPADPPVPGLAVRRGLTTGLWADGEMRFTALLDGQELGTCEVALDLSDNGALPALQQWAQLTELQVEESWRNRGIGAWLVRHAVAWVRLGDRTRLLVATMADNAGAIRFYRRFGWERLVHERKGWALASSTASTSGVSETDATADAADGPPVPPA
jgi:GNAT superfamily N-acetyltransferase